MQKSDEEKKLSTKKFPSNNGRNDQTRVSTFSRNCKIVTKIEDLAVKADEETFRWILFSPFPIWKKNG